MYTTRMKRRVLFVALSLALLAGLAVAARGHYLDGRGPDLLALLPPPPVAGSPQARAEVDELLALQAARTPEQVAYARADASRTPYRFADVLGPGCNKDAAPLLGRLMANVKRDASAAVDPVKNHYNRPRPFKAHPEITPCLSLPSSASYPSGHSTYGHLTAIILARMVPEKAQALLERGEVFARQRLIGGVHYPSDVAAGAVAARALAEALFADPGFLADFEPAKHQLRTALGLSPAA